MTTHQSSTIDPSSGDDVSGRSVVPLFWDAEGALCTIVCVFTTLEDTSSKPAKAPRVRRNIRK